MTSPAVVRGRKIITHMDEQEEGAVETVSNLPAVNAPDMTELVEQLVTVTADSSTNF